MGTKFIVILYAPCKAAANQAFQAAFQRIAALDRMLSDYDTTSELARLSQSSPTQVPKPLSGDLFRVLAKAQELSDISGGAFDVTVGPLTKLWRRAHRQAQLPPADRLQAARAAVGHRWLRLDSTARTAELLKPHMRLDLGGIAKGYAVDQALIELNKRGITRALVNASGDLAASGPPPGRQGWLVGIAPLEPGADPSIFGFLANQAMATSGDAFQFVVINGVRYSHIVDPHTGFGLTQRSSVSILANDCTTADGLASTASVLGPSGGLQLIEKVPGSEALIVVQEGNNVVTRQTTGFRHWITSSK